MFKSGYISMLCTIFVFDTLLIQSGVEIVLDNQQMNGSWDAYLVSPADFVGADDIIANLAKDNEPVIEIIESTP